MSDRHREPGMDDAIDLRLYLEILWRRRFLVGAVLLVALSVAAFLNFVVMRPIYESSATLIIAGPRFQVLVLETARVAPSLVTPENIVPMAHNAVVAAKVLERLPEGTEGRPEALVRKVRIAPIRGTNLVKVTARDTSPGEAAAIAGIWAQEIAEYASLLGVEEARQVLSIVEEQITMVESELAVAERSLRDFQAGSKIPILEQRIQETVRRIALYEVRLAEIGQGGTPAERSPSQMRKVRALRRDLVSSQSALASEKQRETQLLRRVGLGRATSQLLVQKREELRILLEATKGMVKIAVPPVAPHAPVAPRTTLNLTLAAFFGVIAGWALAIAMERFRAPAPGATPPVAAFAPQPSRDDELEVDK